MIPEEGLAVGGDMRDVAGCRLSVVGAGETGLGRDHAQRPVRRRGAQ